LGNVFLFSWKYYNPASNVVGFMPKIKEKEFFNDDERTHTSKICEHLLRQEQAEGDRNQLLTGVVGFDYPPCDFYRG